MPRRSSERTRIGQRKRRSESAERRGSRMYVSPLFLSSSGIKTNTMDPFSSRIKSRNSKPRTPATSSKMKTCVNSWPSCSRRTWRSRMPLLRSACPCPVRRNRPSEAHRRRHPIPCSNAPNFRLRPARSRFNTAENPPRPQPRQRATLCAPTRPAPLLARRGNRHPRPRSRPLATAVRAQTPCFIPSGTMPLRPRRHRRGDSFPPGVGRPGLRRLDSIRRRRRDRLRLRRLRRTAGCRQLRQLMAPGTKWTGRVC